MKMKIQKCIFLQKHGTIQTSMQSTFFQFSNFLREILIQACQFYSKMTAHLRTHSKQKTKERNSKNMLLEQDKWITVEELMTVTMKEFEEVMKIDQHSSIYLFIHIFILIFVAENFIRIRGALLLCLSTFRSPLRQQNWCILVANSPLSSYDEKRSLIEYNKKFYSDKADFVTGFLFKVHLFSLSNLLTILA
jgi:hypothetical protein